VPRPMTVAIMCALVFVGRLALAAWAGRTKREAIASNRRFAEAVSHTGRYIAPALLAVAVALPFIAGRSYLDLGVVVLTYLLLGWGLNIVVGLAGLLDLGYVAFYAVGAYTYAIFSTTYDLGFWTCLPLAGLFAAIAGIALGFPVLRLRGDYLAIVTLGFGEIIRIVINNWTHLTNGPNGILNIPRPTLFGLSFSNSGNPDTFAGVFGLEPSPTYRVAYLYYIVLGLALLTNWVTIRLRRLPLGRAWEALREDEVACRSLGINVTVTKLTAFAMGATFGGFAGAFFATRNAFISPESFTFIESAIVLAIVVLGGLGSQLGVALAAIITIGGLELFRQWLGDLTNQPGFHWVADTLGDIGQYYKLIFGLAMVNMMVLRPRGLVSGRTPSVKLGAAREIAPELVTETRG
jgi:branched-chain amino acid transport system permease protein